MWEDSRDFGKAIDRYLEITEQHFPNKDTLEEIWNNCFNLAMNYEKGKVQEVVAILGQRLLNIEKFESAGELYESVGYHDKAIEAYITSKKWDRATACARQIRPAEMQEMWMEKINGEKKNMHLANNRIDKIVASGDMSGLEVLVQQGRWDECLQLAEK